MGYKLLIPTGLSPSQLRKIDQEYFYIYHLILQCKEAANLETIRG